ncbi:hypothetical protein ACJX0J_025090, partial [Zea mays]
NKKEGRGSNILFHLDKAILFAHKKCSFRCMQALSTFCTSSIEKWATSVTSDYPTKYYHFDAPTIFTLVAIGQSIPHAVQAWALGQEALTQIFQHYHLVAASEVASIILRWHVHMMNWFSITDYAEHLALTEWGAGGLMYETKRVIFL